MRMTNTIVERYFTSGWSFKEDEYVLKSKFQMMNIALILSSAAVLYGVVLNLIMHNHSLAVAEFFLFLLNMALVFLLRKDKKYLLLVAHIETAFMSALILFLIYTINPMELKHVWIFTYPIVILYFKNEKHALYWILFLISMVLISPLQPFIKYQYSMYQIVTLTFVLSITSIIVYFYHLKMQEARGMIFSQSQMLKKKVEELVKKDKILTVQSRQAVMGEMISMVAHQWRQPLSSVTLNISNFQVKRLLGKDVDGKEIDKILENINDTVVYLSDTINDFQTYFHPKKETTCVNISDVVDKALNFTLPRINEHEISIDFKKSNLVEIHTYMNELIQVLLNILNNAIDQLVLNKLTNPQIIIALFEDEANIIIEIKDNAGGIKKEYLDFIFEPYFSTKGKNGTGLGLYMSQMIMQKQFSTDIEVSSHDGETIFRVIVPKKLS